MKTVMMYVAKHISVAVTGPLTTYRYKFDSIAEAFGSESSNGVDTIRIACAVRPTRGVLSTS